MRLFSVIILAGILISSCAPQEDPSQLLEKECKSLIAQLSAACMAYYSDWGCYPPGDGTGSKRLAERLSKNRRRPGEQPQKEPYFKFTEDQLTEEGHIINPVYKDEEPPEIIYYKAPPNTHNEYMFDIWAKDSKGDPQGIKNWTPPPPEKPEEEEKEEEE